MSNSCCTDCGRPGGYSCSANVCKIPGTSNLNWVVQNSCLNGEEILYKFYYETRNMVWPGPTTAWVSRPGSNTTRTLTCYTGDKICFRGRQSMHDTYWGVDLDQSKACTNSCSFCADETVNPGPLTCS